MTTTPIARIPDNLSFLQTTKYTFIIPELPFARYFCQSVNLPGASTTEVAINTPFATTIVDTLARYVATFSHPATHQQR